MQAERLCSTRNLLTEDIGLGGAAEGVEALRVRQRAREHGPP
jgi:hypothetical protein